MSSTDASPKDVPQRHLAQKDLDRTDGHRVEHYSRADVAAANHATEGQDHE